MTNWWTKNIINTQTNKKENWSILNMSKISISNSEKEIQLPIELWKKCLFFLEIIIMKEKVKINTVLFSPIRFTKTVKIIKSTIGEDVGKSIFP